MAGRRLASACREDDLQVYERLAEAEQQLAACRQRLVFKEQQCRQLQRDLQQQGQGAARAGREDDDEDAGAQHKQRVVKALRAVWGELSAARGGAGQAKGAAPAFGDCLQALERAMGCRLAVEVFSSSTAAAAAVASGPTCGERRPRAVQTGCCWAGCNAE